MLLVNANLIFIFIFSMFLCLQYFPSPSHVHFSIFGPAFATRLVTQMYFEGDPLIRDCPMLGSIPDRSAQSRLVAALDMERSRPFDCLAYRFDLVLRGPKQTHFENRPDGL